MKSKSPVRYLERVQQSLSTPAHAATLARELDWASIEDVFRLPSPLREREFVARVLAKHNRLQNAA